MGRAQAIACLCLLTLAGLALRLWHIDFGLPYWFHPDEPLKASKILRITGGDLNPRYFLHPTFMLYATAAVFRVAQRWGLGSDPASAALVGRILNAVLGSLTVALTFPLARTVGGRRFALGAAALVSVAPLHVFCSHYLKEDVPLAFWIVCAALAAHRIARRGELRDYVLAGLLCGAATATKYTGLLSLLLPWLAHRERAAPQRGQLIRLALAAAAGFLLFTPFALLDIATFLRGVGFEGGRAMAGKPEAPISPLSYLWTFHLRYSLFPGMGWIATTAALAGFVTALRRPSPAYRMFTAFVALGYTVFENSPYKPPPNFDRYLVPLIPFLAVLAMTSVRALHRRSAALGWALLLLVLVEPASRSLRLLAVVEPDTRRLARAWLVEHVGADERIALEGQSGSMNGKPIGSYTPQLDGPNVTYTFALERLRDRLDEFDYVVASSFIYDRYVRYSAGDPATQVFYRELLARRPEAAFRPTIRSYGFHNPTILIYRQPKRGS